MNPYSSSISIVIPTYKNAAMIQRCLAALARQSCPLSQMEVVVVVDGSPDDTLAVLKAYAPTAPFAFQLLWQENQGPGPARNYGIRQATHPLILIINDDFLGEPQLVERHLAWHQAHPEVSSVLLGFVEEFEGDGLEFNMSRLDKAFDSLASQSVLTWEHFWTTNISLKKQFLEQSGEWFSNRFPHPVHEDREMGYRLSHHGLKLFHEPRARGVHEHFMTYAQYSRRAFQSGVCLAVFYRLHPELKDTLMAAGLVSLSHRELNPKRAAIAGFVFNPFVVPVLEFLAKQLNRYGYRKVATFLFTRLFGVYQRRGVADGLRRRELGRG